MTQLFNCLFLRNFYVKWLYAYCSFAYDFYFQFNSHHLDTLSSLKQHFFSFTNFDITFLSLLSCQLFKQRKKRKNLWISCWETGMTFSGANCQQRRIRDCHFWELLESLYALFIIWRTGPLCANAHCRLSFLYQYFFRNGGIDMRGWFSSVKVSHFVYAS